jgi:ABC-type phosphate transport system substrate-binding protein
MHTRAFIILAIVAMLSSPVLAVAEDVVIIANENVTAASLGADDIRHIFLGQKTSLDNGLKIMFVVQDRTKAGDAFLEKYLDKTASQYDLYWKKQVFSGKGKMPYSFSSNQELVDFVSRTPGAIGYVSSGTDTGSTKIITVHDGDAAK